MSIDLITLPLSANGVSRRGGFDGGGIVITLGSGVVVGGEDALNKTLSIRKYELVEKFQKNESTLTI